MKAVFDAYRAQVEKVTELDGVDELALYDTLIQPNEVRPSLYAVLFDQTPRREGARFDASRTTSVHTLSLMGVGTSPGEVRWVMEKTEDVLERVRLVVGARTSTPLKKIGNSAIIPPDPGKPAIYTATDVWRCGFDRA